MIRLRGSTGRWRWLVLRALLISGLAVLASCANPTGPSTASDESGDGAGSVSGTNGEAGSVLVSLGSGGGLSASTIFPDQDLTAVASYRVSATDGPTGAPVPAPAFIAADETTGQPASSLAIGEFVPGSWTIDVEGLDSSGNTIFHGAAEGVSVVAGQQTTASITLGYIADGEGGFEITIEWPTAQKIRNVEYRLDNDDWTVVPGSEFNLSADGETTAVTISRSEVPAGAYWFTVRLDAGALATWERYRAMVDEKLYVYRSIVTAETITLGANAFSYRPPEPGSFEDLEESGAINVDPEDGSITFNPDGYDVGDSGDDVTIDPETGSITFENNGERSAYLGTPGVSKARLELTDVLAQGGNRWALAFHGIFNEDEEYSGYTIQFNLNPGTIQVYQWENDGSLGAFMSANVKNAINLKQNLDEVTVEVDGPQMILTVVQGATTLQVFNEADVPAIAPNPAIARTEGILGLRAETATDLSIGSLKLFVLD